MLVIPYRHPLVTAKILATIDQLAGGRVILGAGVGWLREEFEALGAPPFEERGAVTDEYLRFMRATWTTDPVSFTGRYVSVHGVHALRAGPARRHSVWIGGHTDAAVRRAATLGDGWHPIALRPPTAVPRRDATRARRSRWAKDADATSSGHALGARADGGAAQASGAARRRPSVLPGHRRPGVADIRAYAAAGVTHFVFDTRIRTCAPS